MKVIASLLSVSLIVIVSVAVELAAETRPRVGLVLGGGGALGLAHIGVLRALEERHIPVDVITGTSMGSIVGGLYALGRDSREIEKILDTVEWDDLFNDEPTRQALPFRGKADERGFLGKTKFSFKDGNIVLPVGAIYGQKIDLLFNRLFDNREGDFSALPIPLTVIGADVETGQEVVLRKGNLARAVRASMSVPGVFSPVEIEGKLLVDGGISNNLPVDQARALGAEILIVVNLPAHFRTKEELISAIAVAGQVLSFLLDQNAQAQLKNLSPHDVLVQPDLKGFTTTDFTSGAELFTRGYEAVEPHHRELNRLSVGPHAYARWRNELRARAKREPFVSFVRLNNLTTQSDESIRAALEIPTGAPFDRALLEEKINNLYATRQFTQVRYELIEENSQTGILITTEERPWLREFMRIGFQLSDDFEGESAFSLGGAYRWTGLNEAGGEFELGARIGETRRIGFEWYQPLAVTSPYFTALSGQLNRENVRLLQDGKLVGEFERGNDDATVAFGRTIAKDAEIRLGVTRGGGAYRPKVGDPSLTTLDYETGSLISKIAYDTFDNVNFPHRGMRLEARHESHRKELGDSENFSQGALTVTGAIPIDELFLVPSLSAGRSFGSIPRYASFSNGGFFNFSGFQKGELSSEDNVIGRLVAYRTLLGRSRGLLTSPLYGGISLEAGRFLRSSLEDTFITGGSVFLGADTPLIPVYVGIGVAEGGNVAGYFAVDRPF